MHLAFAYLFFFYYLFIKKKKIIAPVPALTSCQYFYSVDVSHRQERQEIAQEAELRSSSEKEANLNTEARFGAVPALAHIECWLQDCRQRSAGRRNKRRLTEGFRNSDLSPTAGWPACHHLNGTSDFSLAQRFNVKAKIRHSVEAPSNLWHNSNNNNNEKLLYT